MKRIRSTAITVGAACLLQANDGKMLVDDGQMLVNDGEMSL